MNTRHFYDYCRTAKYEEQATGPGRYSIDVPGNGVNPCYIEDPQIRVQKWGANLRTNSINLESELLGYDRDVSRDCLGKDEYDKTNVKSEKVSYPNCNVIFTNQPRTSHPAWMVRDLEQVDWYYPPLDPQMNVCIPFENNLSTRIIEKDYFTPKRECQINQANDELPINYELNKGGYVGGPNTCNETNSCQYINQSNNKK